MTSGALEAIERVLDRGGDADDILRAVVAILHQRAGYSWVGISFVEEGHLALGPTAGEEHPGEQRTEVPVSYDGGRVAELAVEGAPEDERPFLEQVAALISAHCLVAWDTGGEAWNP